MKFILPTLMMLHGLIHLLGFVKAFNLAPVSQLVQPISKGQGIFWLFTALVFVCAALFFLLKNDSWSVMAIVAVLLSQYLIYNAWEDAKWGTVANTIILVAAIIGYGTWSFSQKYEDDVKAGLQQTAALSETMLTETDLQHLPEPVRKYLRYTGAIGKPKVTHFKLEFTGQIRASEQSEWMPFVSEQYTFMEATTRLFFMNATMKHLPVAGYHCFKNGHASMDIRLLSLIKVQYQSGSKMDISETVTFFNDMCCMAPATLIDPRIQWLEGDSSKVKAAFTDNGITVSAWLYFNAEGALTNFVSDDRYALAENNELRNAPWSTPLKDYRDFAGHRLATSAETIYRYPEGDFCYGTFHLTHVEYNYKVKDAASGW